MDSNIHHHNHHLCCWLVNMPYRKNAMIHYIKKAGAQPTHSEIAECVQWAMKHALKIR